MATLHIEVPDELRRQMQTRAFASGYPSVEAYAEAILIADATEAPLLDDENLESFLLSRLEGPFVDVEESDFSRLRQRLKERIERGDAGTAK